MQVGVAQSGKETRSAAARVQKVLSLPMSCSISLSSVFTWLLKWRTSPLLTIASRRSESGTLLQSHE